MIWKMILYWPLLLFRSIYEGKVGLDIMKGIEKENMNETFFIFL